MDSDSDAGSDSELLEGTMIVGSLVSESVVVDFLVVVSLSLVEFFSFWFCLLVESGRVFFVVDGVVSLVVVVELIPVKLY